MSDVGARVRRLVIEHLRIDADKVTDDASFTRDLGADSLDAVELVLAFENEFGCEIPDDQVDKLSTVKGAISFIESTQPLAMAK
jgi:acyl carrier protein